MTNNWLNNNPSVPFNLIRKLNNDQDLYKNDMGELLGWVRHRDETIETPVDVPVRWEKFEFIADDISRKTPVTIRCLACNKILGNNEIYFDDDKPQHDWNFRRQKCKAGHNLLIIQAVHVYAPPETHKPEAH